MTKSMSLPKRILFWLILLLMIPTGSLLVLEIGLRIFANDVAATPGYVRTHPTRRYELRPHFNGKTYDAELHVNSYGLRDYERAISSGDDTLRICVVGDSYTFGYGARMEDTFAKVLEKQLQHASDRNVQVFNLGVPSYNTVAELRYLKDSYPRFRPHMVIMQYTVLNDTEALVPPGSPESAGQTAIARWIKDRLRGLYSYNFLAKRYYRLRYQLFVRQQAGNELEARLTHDELLYHDDFRGWLEAQQALRDVVQFCDSNGVDLVFGVVANNVRLAGTLEEDPMRPVIEKVLAAMEQAGAKHIVLLDEAFREHAGNEGVLHVRPDDAHFSALAHTLVADTFFEYMLASGLIE